MKRTIAAACVAALLVPLAASAADEPQAVDTQKEDRLAVLDEVIVTRLAALDEVVVTRLAELDEVIVTRLADFDEVIVTAAKAQPADYKPDAKVAALLAEVAKE